jgi:hypothetical protein
MIRLQLTSDQLRAVLKQYKTELVLTLEQAATVRAQLNQLHARAKPLSCECGDCRTCKVRERVRMYRASK